jgi:hypothetical protein
MDANAEVEAALKVLKWKDHASASHAIGTSLCRLYLDLNAADLGSGRTSESAAPAHHAHSLTTG